MTELESSCLKSDLIQGVMNGNSWQLNIFMIIYEIKFIKNQTYIFYVVLEH
jgi:hypothetical protein